MNLNKEGAACERAEKEFATYERKRCKSNIEFVNFDTIVKARSALPLHLLAMPRAWLDCCRCDVGPPAFCCQLGPHSADTVYKPFVFAPCEDRAVVSVCLQELLPGLEAAAIVKFHGSPKR